ncbi:uncharacterized protein LOC135838891 [Planococcus citri]|uniref:uncharacterized protein LOC135838891 n=1 Tax=Planococcus citri TaxID=170843 RepID=UPI0031F73D9D
MASKKFISRFVCIIVFHATTSLFYLRMLLTFMYTKNVILTGRMITTWYLAFHIGFIFLRLIQDFIDLTPVKSSIFNKNFTKFNNLVFISLIFPFALYLPLLYWLLFLYDSNLMLPNFVEISLPTWVSMSSHSVIGLVALVEMTTTKYTYEGNHLASFIIMSIFSASYIVCLIETYVQYGFWLYPVFHLLPASYLPAVFLMLIALLLFVYFVGNIIAKRFLAMGKSDGKFVEDDSNSINVLSPISNYDSNASRNESSNCRRELKSTSAEEQQAVSSLILIKQVLEKIVLSPLRSNIQKMFREKNPHNFEVGEEAKSSFYLGAKEDRKIPSGAVIKLEENGDKCKIEDGKNFVKKKVAGKKYCYCYEAMENDHEFISRVTILKNISTSQNNNNQSMSSPNLYQENNYSNFESQDFNDSEESPNCKVENDDAYDIYETADEMDPCHENDKIVSPLLKSAAEGKSSTDENVDLNTVSYPIERDDSNKTQRENLYRFRLQLFPHHNCSEKFASKELHRGRKKSTEKTSVEEVLYSKVKKDKQSPFFKKTDSTKESETDSAKFTTDSVTDIQTEDHDLENPLMEDCNGNSHYASISFEKSKIKVIPNIYETCKSASKFGFPKRSKQITPSFIMNKPDTSSGKNISDVSPTPGTSNINILNSSPKNSDSNAERSLPIDSTTEGKSGEKNKKKRKSEHDTSSFETQKPRKIENKLKSINNDTHDWKQDKHDERIHEDVDAKETNVKDGPENKATRGVKFNTMKIFKLNLSKGKRGSNEKINDDDMIKCQCGQNSGQDEPQSKTIKRKKYFIRTFSDSDDKKNKRKKINKIRGSESACSFSTSSLDRIQDRDHTHSVSRIRKEQSAGSSQKPLEKLNEEIGNLQDEKSRYEKLPKLNTRLKKINVASCLCSSETQCKKKKTTGKENYTNESIKDVPVVQEFLSKCTNQTGDNMRKKFIARFFKFSKRTSKGDEEKKLAEIFKCSNGSKIGAIFATIPDKNEIHLNVDLENAKVLQDLQASLSSNGGLSSIGGKQFKFCIFLS